MNYKEAGVDNDLKAQCSKLFYEAAKKTWFNRKKKFGEITACQDAFTGGRGFLLKNDSNYISGLASDGIGTKQVIAQRYSTFTGDFTCHQDIMKDLFAMPADDCPMKGAEPILLNWTINFNKPNLECTRALAKGSVIAAAEAGVAIFSGETAELGDIVGGYGDVRYLADATVFWVAQKDYLLDPKDIEVGDSIVALKEDGFRSNGLTLVRKIAEQAYGDKWHEKEVNGENLAKMALVPSRIYAKAVVQMYGMIWSVAHITGGGIPEKLKRAMAGSNLGASLTNLYEPSKAIKTFQELGKVKDIDAYNTWNMGNGMLIITNTPSQIIEIARRYGIEARIAGEVIKEPYIEILNKGMFNKNESLRFSLC